MEPRDHQIECARIIGVVVGAQLRFPDHEASFTDALAVHNKTVASAARVRAMRAA